MLQSKREKRRRRKRLIWPVFGLFILFSGIWYADSAPVSLAFPADIARQENLSYPREITVEAAGEVCYPGVYTLDNRAVVADVIFLAGGFTNAADKGRLNMEDAVFDGERLLVPARDWEGPLVSRTHPPEETQAEGGRIDLNQAGASALESLPGIGERTAERILAYRAEHGRFGSVDELLEIDGIGETLLENLRDLVVVE